MSKEGKPLLSWRVELLPYLGQESLHKQFKLDEPWDSPANKKLIERMPPILRSPRANPGPGKTCYLAVRGDKYAFPGAKKIGMPDLRDGMSNTILLVEVNDQAGVIWTRPDDFQPDSKQPTKGLERTYHPAHFLAGFADGHTQTIPLTIKPEMLKALFTRDGGEVINLDELR